MQRHKYGQRNRQTCSGQAKVSITDRNLAGLKDDRRIDNGIKCFRRSKTQKWRARSQRDRQTQDCFMDRLSFWRYREENDQDVGGITAPAEIGSIARRKINVDKTSMVIYHCDEWVRCASKFVPGSANRCEKVSRCRSRFQTKILCVGQWD